MLDAKKLGNFVDQCWGDAIVPTLVEYVKIPNKSPAFDPDWAAHGYMEEAVSMFERWARTKLPALPGANPCVKGSEGGSPFGCIFVPQTSHEGRARQGSAA